MTFSPTIRHLLLTVAILAAASIQLVRGYRPIVVVVGLVVFLLVGNLTIYLAGSKERAGRRRAERDYWAGVR